MTEDLQQDQSQHEDERPHQLPDQQILGATLHAELLRRGLTLATAESLTGGALGDLVSASPGASETYLGGVVSYATSVKVRVLGVRQETVEECGVVSAACAREMASGVRELVGADWSVSTTGVAGPTEQEGKPVGTVFVGVAGPDGSVAHELHLEGNRAEIREQACSAAALAVLEDVLGTVRAAD
ncbi:MAG: CinA family protein [Nocardioidaceae bacterium]